MDDVPGGRCADFSPDLPDSTLPATTIVVPTLNEAGKIGSALQAAVEVRCAGDKFEALSSLGDDLKFIFIVSAARVVRDDNEQVEATPLEHAKCERCWHVRDDVGANAEHPTLCGRCVSNLHGTGEARRCA